MVPNWESGWKIGESKDRIRDGIGINIKANYRYNYILGNDHSFFYFNYPDLSPVYDI